MRRRLVRWRASRIPSDIKSDRSAHPSLKSIFNPSHLHVARRRSKRLPEHALNSNSGLFYPREYQSTPCFGTQCAH